MHLLAQRCQACAMAHQKISRWKSSRHMDTNLRFRKKYAASVNRSEQDDNASGFAWVAREPQLIYGAGWRASSQRSIDYHSLPAVRPANRQSDLTLPRPLEGHNGSGPGRFQLLRPLCSCDFRCQLGLLGAKNRGCPEASPRHLYSVRPGACGVDAAPGPDPASAASTGPIRQNPPDAPPRQSVPASRVPGPRSVSAAD